MAIRSSDVTVTTDTSGAGTAYTAPIPGVLHQIVYTKTDFANAGTVTVTSSFSGGTVWRQIGVNAGTVVYPTATVVDGTGTPIAAYAQSVISETCKVVVSGMGSVKTGAYRFVYDDRGE